MRHKKKTGKFALQRKLEQNIPEIDDETSNIITITRLFTFAHYYIIIVCSLLRYYLVTIIIFIICSLLYNYICSLLHYYLLTIITF